MVEFILSVPNSDAGQSALNHLAERTPRFIKFEHKESLADHLGEELDASRFLREQRVAFHLIEISQGAEAAFLGLLREWYEQDFGESPHGMILSAERNQTLYTSSVLGLPVDLNAPGSHHANYLSQMRIQDAHQRGLTGAGVRVALLDSGADDRAVSSADFIDLTIPHPGRSAASDTDGHGTAMALIVHDVAPSAELVPIRILQQSSLSTWDLAAGIAAAIADCEPDIVNISLGILSLSKCGVCGGSATTKSIVIEKMMLMKTPGGKEPIYVSSVGNDFQIHGFRFPASIFNCVAVGAADSAGNRSSFSNYGQLHPLYVMAPGGQLDMHTGRVTEHAGIAGGKKGNPVYGTSPATAYTSGFLAVLRSNPKLAAVRRNVFLATIITKHAAKTATTASSHFEYGNGLLRY